MRQTKDQLLSEEIRQIEERIELVALVTEISAALFGKRHLPPGTRAASYRAAQLCAIINARDGRRLEELVRQSERAKARRAAPSAR